MKSVERHFTPREAADLLALSVATIRSLERRGELHGIRLAGRLRFPESDVSRYLAKAADAPRRTPPAALLANAGRRPRRRRRA